VFFLGDLPPTQYDLRFVLFGIPVRVHPFFWLAAVLTGMPDLSDTNYRLGYLVAWVAAFFLAILIHEMGHALMMRSYGYWPWVTLHGLGGMASYAPGQARTPALGGRIAIAFAGPGAGFLAAALVVLALMAAGKQVEIVLAYYVIPQIMPSLVGSVHLTLFIYYFLHISVFWGFINLLPVQPLDGGQIARELFAHYNPVEGVRLSLMLSFAVAGLMTAVALIHWKSTFAAILFGYLAYQSYAMLAIHGGRGPRW
jgi:Zn-dependent protease